MKIYVYISLVFLLVFLGTAAEAAGLVTGKAAPAYEIRTISGAPITPATARGRVLIVHLWATWCEECRKEMPEIEEFYRRHHAQGVDVVAISLDDKSEMEAVRQAMSSFSFPAAMESDSDLHRFGRVWRVPLTFIIDQRGILRHNGWEGDPMVDTSMLEKVVTPLLTTPVSN
ncbi:sporulation thiol-disulfide oxidoreductase A precursor [mine drainage metagenome]|uniref:Sporulation thiol-disulfide oxidoreductase A n=1 Tax=mine drainage metagenome TaxID=410659 RepID=A0A1J5QMG4_9ZZZZ